MNSNDRDDYSKRWLILLFACLAIFLYSDCQFVPKGKTPDPQGWFLLR